MYLFRERGFYEKYVKRMLDIICAVLALVLFGWLYIFVAVLTRIYLGSPVVFKQPRPGLVDSKTGKERIFYMYKFRSMSDKRNSTGELLPDEERLGHFGKALRASSLDELMEVFNILKGDMSVIGPRPQLVKDMVFMTTEQRLRHTARPGLSGLAQVKGRNAITWEEKLTWDLKYIDNITFLGDLQLVWLTFKKVFVRSNITKSNEEIDVTLDYGDSLLNEGKITQEQYDAFQSEAKRILEEVA